LTEYGQQAGKVVSKVDMYNNVLDKSASCRDAVIEVEKASCPILLISGRDDQLWPSERMADLIMDRLRERNYPYEYRHITYPSAGHRIKVPGLDDSRYAPVSEDTVTHEVLNLGGTLEGNKAASERSFSETVQFFRENLG
jgi:dienelactone hydrolase